MRTKEYISIAGIYRGLTCIDWLLTPWLVDLLLLDLLVADPSAGTCTWCVVYCRCTAYCGCTAGVLHSRLCRVATVSKFSKFYPNFKYGALFLVCSFYKMCFKEIKKWIYVIHQ
jgi:hypothetical protein